MQFVLAVAPRCDWTATYTSPNAISPQIAIFWFEDIWTFHSTTTGKLVHIKSVTIAKARDHIYQLHVWYETEEHTALKIPDVQINLDGPAVAFDLRIPERF